MRLPTSTLTIRLAAAAVLAAGFGGTAAAQTTLVWVDGGGAYHDAVQEHILTPWEEKSGDTVVSVAGTDNAKLRAMVEAGRVDWDVYNGDNTWAPTPTRSGSSRSTTM